MRSLTSEIFFFASPVARVMAGGVMISFSAVFARLTTVEPDVAAFYRTFVGGLFLVALSIGSGRSLWLSRRVLPWAVGAGASLVLDLIFWHRSISIVGPGLATILINFQVFVLAVAGWLCFLKRYPNGCWWPSPWPWPDCGSLWAWMWPGCRRTP